MKKIFACLLAALLLISITTTIAEEMDFASMSDDELHALVDGARNELAKRELSAAEDTVILEQDGVNVYLTGNKEIQDYSNELQIEAVVVNDTNKNISVIIDSASVNGWNVFGSGISTTTAGKKQKGSFWLYLDGADVSALEEVEDVELSLYLYDDDSYETIGDKLTVELHFGE